MKVGKGGETWDYVLKQDRDLPPAERTVFKLKGLTTDEYMASLDVESRAGYGSSALTRIMAGLVGWKNLRDADGNDIKFAVNDGNVVKMELLDLIVSAPGGANAILELSAAIRNHSTWTEEEEKNFESPDASSPEN